MVLNIAPVWHVGKTNRDVMPTLAKVCITSWVPMIFCHYMLVLWWKTSWVFPLDVSIVMEKYTAICSWACSWGYSHACSHLHTSTVMEQHTATCSWACSHSCSHLHKYKWLQEWLQEWLQVAVYDCSNFHDVSMIYYHLMLVVRLVVI